MTEPPDLTPDSAAAAAIAASHADLLALLSLTWVALQSLAALSGRMSEVAGAALDAEIATAESLGAPAKTLETLNDLRAQLQTGAVGSASTAELEQALIRAADRLGTPEP
jgi:hypothetical protein